MCMFVIIISATLSQWTRLGHDQLYFIDQKNIRSTHVHCASVGVATSSNGVDWTRAPSASSAAPSATAEDDKKKKDENSGPQGQGCVMQPGEDWWTFDTCHMAVSDVQVGN